MLMCVRRGLTPAIGGSRPTDYPFRWTLSRVCSNAWFAVVGGSYSEKKRSYSSWPPIQYQKNVSS